MPARAAASYQAVDRRFAETRCAGGTRQVWSGRGRVHRRSRVHPPLGLSDAHREGQPRSFAARSGGDRARWLRRLRTVRRKRPCGHTVSVVLSRRNRAQPELARARAGTRARRCTQVPSCGLKMNEAAHSMQNVEPITLLVCALGGEGGGVLAEWLVEAATRAGYPAQSTSIPGVAQRTGATTYYIEVFPAPATALNGRAPVFGLSPVAGALDALVSSELLETTRQVGLGLVSNDRTLVISARDRTLTTAEKMAPADGRVADEQLIEVLHANSRLAHLLDMQALAQRSGTVVSAVMLGAIAGCGLFPIGRADYEASIRASGKGVEASLGGFAAAFEAVKATTAQVQIARGSDVTANAPT